MAPEARGLSAVGIPDVERSAEHIAAGVVDQITTEIFVAEEDLDVAREGEDARVRGESRLARSIA